MSAEETTYRVVSSKPGIIELGDGSKLILRIVVVGVKYAGFSPFGGVNFMVKTAGGVASLHIPDELMAMVKDKPLYAGGELPRDGWELVDIERSEPSMEEVEVEAMGRRYRVTVMGEASMASRNLSYRSDAGEPLYWVSWGVRVRWKAQQG